MRSRRLDPLLKVVQQRQDTAAREVAERDRVLAEQQDRLDALRRYAEEYTAATVATTTPALLVNRLAFRERLNAAVVQQAGIVDHNKQLSDVDRMRLMLASRETKVLEQLSNSYRARETHESNQRVQRELDDLGARRRGTGMAEGEGEAEDKDPTP